MKHKLQGHEYKILEKFPIKREIINMRKFLPCFLLSYAIFPSNFIENGIIFIIISIIMNPPFI